MYIKYFLQRGMDWNNVYLYGYYVNRLCELDIYFWNKYIFKMI